ncbi:SpoVG family protein [Ruminococcaceae bacterium OttesenSCG-928-D13]|nr:SpoVG family protein [Ruminococcaceae bacterium OttesenSCG-928-D13]
MPKKAAPVAQTQETPASSSLPMEYDVRIQSLKMNGNSRATASVNINGGFAVRGVSVMEGKNGLFVSMPSVKLENGEYLDHCFPCTKESRAAFDKAVLDAYQQVLTHGLNGQKQENPAQLPLEYTVKIQSLRPGSGSLKGTASVNLNDQFAIRRVSIMESSKGLFVSMPGFKGFKGYQDYCFPCTKESFTQFQNTVLDAYQQAIVQSQEAGQQMEAPDPFAAQTKNTAPVMQM